MRKKLTAGLIFAGALALGLMMGDVFDSPRTARSAPEKPDVDEEEMEELRDFGDKFGKLFHLNAEKVSPSVVWIQAEKTVKMRRPGFDDPFFRRFFGPDSDDMFGEREREFRQEGLGSGFIISEEGHILTNNHVVAEADKLRVKLANGEEFAAEVAGADPSTELAVIQMEGDFGDLEVAELGDSDDIRVGEWVIAIGNPMGLERTVSSGIVSAKGRNIGLARYENLIQTDAAINPGNSGGPLINLQGEVIGINTAIVSRTGGNMGIGLAVPINVARSIIEDLKAGREVERGFLGIAGADLSPELANQFDYDGDGGALVNEVADGTPADKAGLEPGDIITSWDGTDVDDFAHLQRLVADTRPGTEAELEFWREGESQAVTVEVERLEDEQAAREPSWIGLEVASVSDEAREYYDQPDLDGVEVENVDPAGPARQLEQGDVILAVGRGRKPIKSVDDFNAYVADVEEGEAALLYVLRKGSQRAQFIIIRRP